MTHLLESGIRLNTILLSGLLPLFFGFSSCYLINAQSENELLYDCEQDLCQEISWPDGTSIEDYEKDNLIYLAGRTFSFRIIDFPPGINVNPDTGWVELTVDPSSAELIRSMVGEYHQTGMRTNYTNWFGAPTAETGLIENKRNVWLHPFREGDRLAKMNLNAYPFISLPIRINKKWTWSLEVGGDKYADFLPEDEQTTMRHHAYELRSIEEFESPLSQDPIEVAVIIAQSSGTAGVSNAKFWFCDQYGFIRMEHTNLDQSRTIFELVAVNFKTGE